MTTLESILLVLLLASILDVIRAHRLKREAIAGWARCIHERTANAQNNYDLRARLIALAMRNEDLENKVSAITSRRYEGN